MASAPKVLETATSVTAAGSRAASRQARSISRWTAARPVWRVVVLTRPSITPGLNAQNPARPGFAMRRSMQPRSGRGLPLRLDVLARLVEMDVLVDVVHPIRRDQMVRAAGLGILLGQFD